jgi:deoxyribonuclease V
MRIPRIPHRWSLSPREAIALQKRMAALVQPMPVTDEPRWIAGLDAAFSADGRECIGAVVLWDIVERQACEQHTAHRELTFPYIPGLLSFREMPALLDALRQLKRVPDVLMCDGQGLAHPRRFGLACHLGVICSLPTLGCAKTRLVGVHAELDRERGAQAPLWHRGEIVGSVLRTQTGVKPVYVSIGHLIDLPTAERIVLSSAITSRLPEPTRLADRLVRLKKTKLCPPTQSTR